MIGILKLNVGPAWAGVANFPGKTDVARFVPSPRYSGERVRGKTFNPEKRISKGERFAPHPSPLP